MPSHLVMELLALRLSYSSLLIIKVETKASGELDLGVPRRGKQRNGGVFLDGREEESGDGKKWRSGRRNRGIAASDYGRRRCGRK